MKKNHFCFLFFQLLFFVSAAQQLSPSIAWQRCLGGSKEDKANSTIKTSTGFLIVGSSKSNDLQVTGHHGSTDSTDAWVIKMDNFGGIEWQKSIGGSGRDMFNSVVATNDNGYLCIGSTSSNDGDISGNHGALDCWLVKLDAAGSILWSKCLGGSNNDAGNSIRQTNDGGYIACGYSASGNGTLTSNYGGEDAWVIKLDASGNIQWQKTFGKENKDFAFDIIQTRDSNYVVSCYTQPNQIYYIDGKGFMAKLSKNTGNMIWGDSIPVFSGFYDRSGSYYWNVRETLKGDILLLYEDLQNSTLTRSFQMAIYNASTGAAKARSVFSNSFQRYEFPGPNSVEIMPDSNFVSANTELSSTDYTAFLIKTNKSLNNIYTADYGGAAIDKITGLVSLGGEDLFICGYTNSVNGNVSGNHGDYDVWIAKLGAINTISGRVFIDYNRNGIADAGDITYPGARVETSKSSVINSTITNYNGTFTNNSDTGITTTTVFPIKPYYNVVPSSAQSAFFTYGNTRSFNFALQPITGKHDVTVSLVPVTAARAGFETKYVVFFKNEGTDTVQNGAIRLVKPGQLFFSAASPSPDSVRGDTLIWNYNNLTPMSVRSIVVTMLVFPPPSVSINDTLKSAIAIFPLDNDLAPDDNQALLKQVVQGSYDPNDKTEGNGGIITKEQANNKGFLTYTIRYQNTGTDTAFNVVVRDTLDQKLDWSTFEIIDTSKTSVLTINDGNKLTWTFKNVKLPDSTHNEPASHGYIVYRVRPKSILQHGDTIHNSASIYFDFNPSVRTNTQITILQPLPPPSPSVTGFQNTYCSSVGLQKIKIINLPGAGSAITVIAKLDSTTSLAIAADSTFSITPSSLTAANHSVVITFVNNSGSQTTTINFSVVQAVTPDVSLSANITTVVNLTDPVIITANNLKGGGTLPLYTFAKDKAFTNILQAEGNSNVLSVQPNTLTVGSNWIYCSMKTSDTCYTTQTNTDSIKVERSAVTGLTDIDFPSQQISAYPNPFSHTLTVSGLNTGKIYTLILTSSIGQQVFSRQISNSRIAIIEKNGLSNGRYLLSIYDARKQKLIGTLPILKQ